MVQLYDGHFPNDENLMVSMVGTWRLEAAEDSTPGRLLRIVASIAPPLLSAARARDLSNLAWAFATLDLRKFDSVPGLQKGQGPRSLGRPLVQAVSKIIGV